MIKRTERICNKGANSVGYIKESHDELSTRVCMSSNEKKFFFSPSQVPSKMNTREMKLMKDTGRRKGVVGGDNVVLPVLLKLERM